MTAEIKPIKTAAELGLAEAFAALRPRLAGNPVAARREEAFRRFEAAGLPHRRVEEWKYTDLRALMRDAKPLAAPPDAAAKARARSAGAVLGGIDALVFTAGVGERSAEIRKRVCEKLNYLGLDLDPAANENCKPDADISVPASKARILVIATREDLTIMRETRRLVGSSVNGRHAKEKTRPSLTNR